MNRKIYVYHLTIMFILLLSFPVLSQWNYYVNDHLGNTRVVLDEAGDVKEFYDYYPFGLSLRENIVGDEKARFKFTGKELDEEQGLDWYYFGARYYDASIGRWLSLDPLAGKYQSLSPYNYVANNPLLFVDYDGNDFGISKSASGNKNFKKAWNAWQSTKIGQSVLRSIEKNSGIMVYFDIGKSEYAAGSTNFQVEGIVNIAREKGSDLVTKMDNKVTVAETGAKESQTIIIVTINENSLETMNSGEASKILNHESQAHVTNDPNNKKSQTKDHAKYSGKYPNGKPRPDNDPAKGTQADLYNKEVDRLKKEQKER